VFRSHWWAAVTPSAYRDQGWGEGALGLESNANLNGLSAGLAEFSTLCMYHMLSGSNDQ